MDTEDPTPPQKRQKFYRVPYELAPTVMIMAEADHRSRVSWLRWMIEKEWRTRDPKTGRKVHNPEDELRAQVADLRERIGRLEGAITVLMTDRKNRIRQSP